MKIQIRKKVFETNSSSMHSLIMINDINEYFSKEEIIEEITPYINSKNNFHAKYECWYYGRAPFRILDGFLDKWKYAIANFYDSPSFSGQYKELLDFLRRYVKINKYYFPHDIGVDDRKLNSWLTQYNISLKEFLLNKKYMVICDGDEYCISLDLLNSGILNKEAYKSTLEEIK